MNLRIKGGRSCFYQWDSGQTVIVEHEGTIHEVHFAHKGDKNALTVITKEIENGVEANVPNILLQSAETLFAYLVFRDADGTETRKAVSIPVLARPKPETYVYTESEVLNYAYLDERLKDLEGEGLANAIEDYLKENPVAGGAGIIVSDTAPEDTSVLWIDPNDNETDSGSGSGVVVSDSAPEDTSVLWVDTDDNEADNLQEAINEALAQAKASGEFDGDDYVLTEADKQEIAELAAEMVDVPDTYTKTEINAIMGSYITDIDNLIGGDS